MEFIYSNINWSSLPKHEDKAIEVIVRFSGSEKGTVDSVQVLRGYDTIFDQEAIRVIKAIPDWDILYRHGKPVWAPWTLPIVFNKENEEKYRK
jgi:outer membrane biosynthesis protein TonB